MYHISVPPKHLTNKSAGYIIHAVFLVTLLILNYIGQGWLHNVSCDWAILKIHFYKKESCYSWATALITRPPGSTTVLSEYQQVLSYGPCQAIGNNICYPCGKYPSHEEMTKIVYIRQKASLLHDHLTAEHIRTNIWFGQLIQTWFITVKSTI